MLVLVIEKLMNIFESALHVQRRGGNSFKLLGKSPGAAPPTRESECLMADKVLLRSIIGHRPLVCWDDAPVATIAATGASRTVDQNSFHSLS